MIARLPIPRTARARLRPAVRPPAPCGGRCALGGAPGTELGRLIIKMLSDLQHHHSSGSALRTAGPLVRSHLWLCARSLRLMIVIHSRAPPTLSLMLIMHPPRVTSGATCLTPTRTREPPVPLPEPDGRRSAMRLRSAQHVTTLHTPRVRRVALGLARGWLQTEPHPLSRCALAHEGGLRHEALRGAARLSRAPPPAETNIRAHERL